MAMKARVFNNGRSQAFRIPREFRFSVDEVFINRIGDMIMLTPIESLAQSFDRGVSILTEDFMAESVPDEIEPVREGL